MTTSSPVALTGPLAPAADGFHQELERLGHGPRSHRRQECLLADLSLWMDERGVQPGALTSRAIAAYLEERRRCGLRLVTQVGARPLLQYLRLGGVIPDAYRDAPAGPLGALLERYHAYLTNERGLNARNHRELRQITESASPTGDAGQLRLMDTRQASAPLGILLVAIVEASIDSTCHPSRKLALISSWVTRRGPQSPGWRSLKHST
jgi:hypothetical protein